MTTIHNYLGFSQCLQSLDCPKRAGSSVSLQVKTLDMGFVLDLTGSMQKWLNLLTKKIQQIIEDCLQHMGHFARVRIAIVGYRAWMEK